MRDLSELNCENMLDATIFSCNVHHYLENEKQRKTHFS